MCPIQTECPGMVCNPFVTITRYQVWQRMEENGHINMKVNPNQIEFTLPSPKLGIESLPVIDPPWMPKLKTKVEEMSIQGRGQVNNLFTKFSKMLKYRSNLKRVSSGFGL